MRYIRYFNIVFSVILICWILSNIFDIYRVSSASMSPTYNQGDYVLIAKTEKGIFDLFFKKRSIKRGSSYIFKLPNHYSNQKYYSNDINTFFMKRCVGIAGDSLQIKNEKIFINSKPDRKLDLSNIDAIIKFDILGGYYYPHDSTVNWTTKKYGPIYIPRSTDEIVKTNFNEIVYSDLIGDYNSSKISFDDDYYFFIGDNSRISIDSRHYGFIPSQCIVGRVVCVVW
ncbi:MAG: signal peptidase I [Bacteroidales bacterium]|nr:signal peptidase I [Bacteroidales bacterium]